MKVHKLNPAFKKTKCGKEPHRCFTSTLWKHVTCEICLLHKGISKRDIERKTNKALREHNKKDLLNKDKKPDMDKLRAFWSKKNGS